VKILESQLAGKCTISKEYSSDFAEFLPARVSREFLLFVISQILKIQQYGLLVHYINFFFHKKSHFRRMGTTVGTIDIGTNPSEPTSECGLGNRENSSEPTTPLLSPQYGKSQSSKINLSFCSLEFSDFPYLMAPDKKSENLSQSYLVAPDEKSEKISQQNVSLISLASTFPYCGLGRGVVSSKGLSRFPSPHSLVGSDGFVPMSIVPTVPGVDPRVAGVGSEILQKLMYHAKRKVVLLNALHEKAR